MRQKLSAMDAATSMHFPSSMGRTEGKRVSMTVFLKKLWMKEMNRTHLLKDRITLGR